MICNCKCHPNGKFCSLCFETFHMEKPKYKNGLKPKREESGRCNYPRDDCSPCELKEGHMGIHRHGMTWYDDSGVPEIW